MRVLDLFSGIGGFSLGLERAGMRTVAFCECDPYCQRVLRKHWPHVHCYDDVRTLTANQIFQNSHGELPDVICGGFPCQDISLAGKGAGLAGARSGLWSEYRRLIGEIRPRYVIVENVAGLLARGLGTILGELAELGYDAEWRCIRAADVGAPHLRNRIWVVAYPHSDELRDELRGCRGPSREGASFFGNYGAQEPVADAVGIGLEIAAEGPQQQGRQEIATGSAPADAGDSDSQGQLQPQGTVTAEWRRPSDSSWWSVEPDVGRVAHGVPSRVDRIRSLGNAVVPQIVEEIGRAIMRATVG